jgi:hypothetical protein
MSEFTGLEHMSREHYAGFGMVITMTCHLDGLLDQIIIAMTKSTNEPAFYPILTFLSAKDKRDYIVAMAGVSTWPPYAIDGLTRLMARAKKALDLRNSIAHNIWRRGRRVGTIKPMSMSARGGLKLLGSEQNEREWTAPQLEAEARKIHQLGMDLAEFMKRYGLVSLPEKPPSRPHVTRNRKRDTPLRDR